MRNIRKFLLSVLVVLAAFAAVAAFSACEETEYLVTFNYNYGTVAPSILSTEDGEVVYVDDPVREGYEFWGWYLDPDGQQPFGGTVSGNTTLYAKWIVERQSFTVSYYVNGSLYDTASVKDGDKLTLPEYRTEENVRFDGWTSGGTLYTAGTEFGVTGAVEFTAQFTNLYAVSYSVFGEIVKTEYVARGESLTIPYGGEYNLGDGFLGWAQTIGGKIYVGGETYTLATADPVVFYSQVEGAYTLAFEADGGEGALPATTQYNSGENIELPAALTRENYRFAGWSDGTNTYEAQSGFTMPAQDVALTAVWIKQVTLTFHYNYYGAADDHGAADDVYYSVTIDEGKRAKDYMPASPERDGDHNFQSWCTDSAGTSGFVTALAVKADTDVYATWSHKYFAFTYTEDMSGYYVSALSSPDLSGFAADSTLTFPSTYNGLPVAGILPTTSTMGPLWVLFNSAMNNSPLTSVLIPASWTEIPAYAFAMCSQTLKHVYFENVNNITRIGEYAFYMCNVLESFEFSPNLEYIGEHAFRRCDLLASVDLSNTKITEIPEYTFLSCYGLREVKFPQTLEKIGDFAFRNAFVYYSDLYVREETSREDVVFEKPEIIIDIPASVTYIGAWAFSNATSINDAYDDEQNTMPYDELNVNYNSYSVGSVWYINYTYSLITEIHIPSGVQFLGRGCFSAAENLTTVTFGTEFALDTFEDYLFWGTAVTDFSIPSSVTTFGTAVFMRCSNLGVFDVPAQVTKLGRRTFAYTGVETVRFAENARIDFDEIALFDHSEIQYITIPASVTTISAVCFQTCKNLTTVDFAGNDNLVSISNYAFANAGVTSITLPDSLRVIGDYAFAGTKLKSVYLGTNISNGSLDEITLEEGAGTWLGSYVFLECAELEKVELASDCKLEWFGFYMFAGCVNLKEVILSDNIRTLNNTYVKETYGSNVGIWYTNQAFNGCTSLLNITIPATNPYIRAEGNAVYSLNGEYLMWYSLAATDTTVRVADGVKYVEDYVFYGNTTITKIIFPASVVTLGNAACQLMTSLQEVEFEDASKLTGLGNFAFGNITIYPTYESSSGVIMTDYNRAPISKPLKSVTFTSTVPPAVGSKIFVWSTENADFTIYVPAESVEAYKQALAEYADYIKAIGDESADGADDGGTSGEDDASLPSEETSGDNGETTDGSGADGAVSDGQS